MALAYILFFMIAYLVGLTTFWLHEAMSLAHVKRSLAMLLGGAMAPIALFPAWLQALASVLPFRYIYAFPVDIYLGRVARRGDRRGTGHAGGLDRGLLRRLPRDVAGRHAALRIVGG